MFCFVIMGLESIHRGYETDIHSSMTLLPLVQQVLNTAYSPVLSGFLCICVPATSWKPFFCNPVITLSE
jgi:hypothetical protein